jgi:hypothetical protein
VSRTDTKGDGAGLDFVAKFRSSDLASWRGHHVSLMLLSTTNEARISDVWRGDETKSKYNSKS